MATEQVGGLPLVEVRIDEDGDVDPAGERALAAELDRAGATDLVVFSHGWNNTPEVARRLYRAFVSRLAPLARRHAADRSLVLAGVFWPSIRWSDEPIPDFEPPEAPRSVDLAGTGGAAGLGGPAGFPPPPRPDAQLTADLRALFADRQPVVEELLELLVARPSSAAAVARARTLLAELAGAAGPVGDGEQSDAEPLAARPDPDAELFDSFALALEDQGVVIDDPGGEAGLRDTFARLWDGGQEALRQVSYWRMKQRAGVVGQRGLGPLLRRLLDDRPGLGVHLLGHSFGARVVGYALLGLPDAVAGAPPVRGLTLLQGAFSHFAFAGTLPFDAGRSGALAGQEAKVAGRVVACYSEHDSAIKVFYPLASMLAREDAAGLADRLARWGGIGYDGHQAGVHEVPLQRPGSRYDFGDARLVNIDAASVVRRGVPPVGAHSDIVHDELAWVVMAAGGLVP